MNKSELRVVLYGVITKSWRGYAGRDVRHEEAAQQHLAAAKKHRDAHAALSGVHKEFPVDDEPDLHSALAEAMLEIATEAAENGDDPEEGLERLRELASEPEALAAFLNKLQGGGSVAKSFTVFKAWDDNDLVNEMLADIEIEQAPFE